MHHKFNKIVIKYFWNILAVGCIGLGIIALVTPLTPGSWLIFVGLFIIFGKEKTKNKIEEILGKKWFHKFGIKKIFNKIP